MIDLALVSVAAMWCASLLCVVIRVSRMQKTPQHEFMRGCGGDSEVAW